MAPGIPLATYRLQLTAEFGFDAAAQIVPYLKLLGVTHVYASPFMKARSGSTHGYDIIDHNTLNPELGGDDGFERLSATLKSHGLGLILDFVPNHMGVHFADNPWWLDVLEWGDASPCAASFDIDWEILPFRRRPGVLLPILGTSYGQALEQGEIILKFDRAEGSFSAWYYEHRLPITPNRYSEILHVILNAAQDSDRPTTDQLRDVAARHHGLARPRRHEAPGMKAALASIDGGAAIIERGLAAYRAGPDRPEETLMLHHLLERQHYRLTDWRLATSEINYRRFFDINTLAGLRVEHAATFQNIHGLVTRLVAEDKLQGLRLDHIDGLRDPAGYCQRLRRLIRSVQPDLSRPFYLLVEKILGENEALPRLAGVHGTTGYETLNILTGVLVNNEGLSALDDIWRQATNSSPDFDPVLLRAKRRVIRTMLTSEFTVLSRLLARIAAGHYSTRDYSADELREAFELYVLHFPVYRTYLTANSVSEHDRQLIVSTIERARSHWAGSNSGIFNFLRDVLTLDLIKPGNPPHSKPRVRRFALKVQQFTGPMMAKSLEDTAFYRHHRLLALNEVGGNPAAHEIPVGSFHRMMSERAANWPHALTTTATHDTKRGEDARARIASLSEFAGEWGVEVSRWKQLNAMLVTTRSDIRIPSLAHEYMLYQSLIGAWPSEGPPEGSGEPFVERIQAFAIKAARESKQHTSWINPNEIYEERFKDFIQKILDQKMSGEFIASFASFAQRTSLLGTLNSLAQLTLKATIPGVPDFYQGTEFWDLSLVDPDNRRPVNFGERNDALTARVIATTDRDWSNLIARRQDAHVKLQWTRHLLAWRREQADLFTLGDYYPLNVRGKHRDNVIAFARRYRRDAVVVLICRKLANLTDGGRFWPDFSKLEASVDLDNLALEHIESSNTELQLASVLRTLPVAVLRAKAQTEKIVGGSEAVREHGRTA
jgi:(1->4)-alpha-D-glucan 1-alpha-D-glucosylmutase